MMLGMPAGRKLHASGLDQQLSVRRHRFARMGHQSQNRRLQLRRVGLDLARPRTKAGWPGECGPPPWLQSIGAMRRSTPFSSIVSGCPTWRVPKASSRRVISSAAAAAR